MERKPKAVGYVRYSPRPVGGELGMEAQTEKIREYAKLYDLDLVEVITDSSMSGKSLDRPGIQRALELVRGPQADMLLVYKLDRLTRRLRDLDLLLDEVKAKKWQLASVSDKMDTDTASGRLVINILGAVAQWEREAIGERTREALAVRKRSGFRLGGARLGERMVSQVDADGRTVRRYAEPDENEMAGLAWARRAVGSVKWSEILAYLNLRYPREPSSTGAARAWTRGGLKGALNG